MKDVIIFGNGQFAEMVHFYVTTDGGWNIKAFTVDGEYMYDDSFLGLPVVPFEELCARSAADQERMLVAIGYSNLNQTRQNVYEKVKAAGFELASFVHSTSVVPNNALIGEHCMIFENNVLQPFSQLGNNVVLWSSNVIGHHSSIGDHAFITSNSATGGFARVGQRCFVGFNSGVAPGVTVGDDCIIGAHCLILAQAEPGGVYRASSAERSRVPSHRVRIF